jgi:hypothetical protein
MENVVNCYVTAIKRVESSTVVESTLLYKYLSSVTCGRRGCYLEGIL